MSYLVLRFVSFVNIINVITRFFYFFFFLAGHLHRSGTTAAPRRSPVEHYWLIYPVWKGPSDVCTLFSSIFRFFFFTLARRYLLCMPRIFFLFFFSLHQHSVLDNIAWILALKKHSDPLLMSFIYARSHCIIYIFFYFYSVRPLSSEPMLLFYSADSSFASSPSYASQFSSSTS